MDYEITVVHTRPTGAAAGVIEEFTVSIPKHIKMVKGIGIYHETPSPTLSIQVKNKSGLEIVQFTPTQKFEYGSNVDLDKRYKTLNIPNNDYELSFATRPFITLVADNTIHITLTCETD